MDNPKEFFGFIVNTTLNTTLLEEPKSGDFGVVGIILLLLIILPLAGIICFCCYGACLELNDTIKDYIRFRINERDNRYNVNDERYGDDEIYGVDIEGENQREDRSNNNYIEKKLTDYIVDKMNYLNAEKEIESNENTCSICLDTLETKKVILNCGHPFHVECVNEWIKSQFEKERLSNCPLCRDTILIPKEENRIMENTIPEVTIPEVPIKEETIIDIPSRRVSYNYSSDEEFLNY